MTRFHVQCAARCLRAGGIIAQATEGVWGLACDATDDQAIGRLIDLKRRSTAKGLIVAIESVQRVAPALTRLTPARRKEILSSWPGHNTWLVPDAEALALSPLVRGDSGKTAVRVPDHAQMRSLLEACGLPLVTTSANPSGHQAARCALRVRQYFGVAIDMLLPGKLGSAAGPSEIRDAVTGALVRAGSRRRP